jgi:lantibiotic modifying enzyme
MIQGRFVDNPGLLTGKMGIAIFFFHYSHHTQNTLYEEFAGELLDEVFEEIHIETPMDFAKGLCGIAWGILHLIEHGFVDADPDEVLSDIDQAIMKYDVRKITDTSLDTGLQGVAQYILQRKTINASYVQELTENMKFHNLQITDNGSLLQTIVENFEIDNEIFEQQQSLSIANNGIAGIGLKVMFGNNEKN